MSQVFGDDPAGLRGESWGTGLVAVGIVGDTMTNPARLMSMIAVTAAGLTAALALVAGKAEAATTLLDFSGSGITGSLDITTGSVTAANPFPCATCNSTLANVALSVTGDVNGNPITGMLPALGYAGNDNNLYSTAPLLDWGGIGFATAGISYNLFQGDFAGHAGYYLCSTGFNIGCTSTVYDNPISLRAGVPEPAAWVMLVIGFGGLGAAMRSRRRQSIATT